MNDGGEATKGFAARLEPTDSRDALMTPSVLNPGLLVSAWEANRWWRAAGDVFTLSVGAARRAAWAQLQKAVRMWRINEELHVSQRALCTAGGSRHRRKHLYTSALKTQTIIQPVSRSWISSVSSATVVHVWQKPLPALKNPNWDKNMELDVCRWVDPG